MPDPSLFTWKPPADWLRIQTIDMHTGGEPTRVIVGGFPELRGAGILALRRDVRARFDHLRKALMWEPRGHADMYGLLPVPPERADSDFGVLFMHNDGYSTHCGHATIAIARLAVELGWVKKKTPVTTVTVDAPCGQLKAFVHFREQRITHIRMRSVPAFAAGLDLEAEVPGIGTVRYDLAYGGAFYAYVRADSLGLALVPGRIRDLIAYGMAIKEAVKRTNKEISHPFEKDLGFLYGTIFTGGPAGAGADDPHVCIFANGEVDRSPTGSGVAGRMALMAARGDVKQGETKTFESITGSVFRSRIVENVVWGNRDCVIPEVEGMAWITGHHEFFIDPDDPFREGFLLR